MMIKQLRLAGFLSFAPGSEPFELRPLNVLIGPNGSGKSNMIEALGLLAAASRDLGQAVRAGWGSAEWLWKGHPPAVEARIEAVLDRSSTPNRRELRYRLMLGPVRARLELLGEAVEKAGANDQEEHAYWYYQLEGGRPTIYGRTGDPERYREVTGVDQALSGIRTFNEWMSGRHTPRRDAWTASLPEDRMFPDGQDPALLAEVLIEASRRVQLVVTTHSDALVSALSNQPDSVVACERPGAGTELSRLDPAKLASWLEDYCLGDLWRMGALGANP